MTEQTTAQEPPMELTALTPHCHWATLASEPRITLITLENAHRKTIDAWVNFGIALRKDWDADEMMLILVDLSEGQFSFTRYATSRAQDMMGVRPEIDERVAVVAPSTALGRLIEMSMKLANRVSHQSINVFRTRDAAADWLRAEHAAAQAAAQEHAR